MRKLYDVQVVKPFTHGSSRPSRLGYQTVAWCEGLDLIAVVSGCGGVAIFHADAPGEAVLLYSNKKAAARHVAWRPWKHSLASQRVPMLLVADACGRLTFWASKDCRVNIWGALVSVSVESSIMAIGWTRDASIATAVLSNGTIHVWRLNEKYNGELKVRALEPNITPAGDKKRLQGTVKCASIAPGGVTEDCVALLTVSEAQPSSVDVWHITPVRDSNYPDGPKLRFDRTTLGSAKLENDKCIACLAAPPKGSLFAFGESGAIEKWILAKSRQNADEGQQWVKAGRYEPYDMCHITQPPRVTAVYISMDGFKAMTSDARNGLFVLDGRRLGENGSTSHPLEPGRLPHWGLCFSPSGLCVMALTGDGVVQMWAITNPTPSPGDLAEQLKTRTSEDGRRGCWDVLALLVKLGKEAAASVAKSLAQHYRDDKIDPLRLAVLSAVDANTAAVSAARKLLEAAIHAIYTSTSPAVNLRLNMHQMDAKTLTSSEVVLQYVHEAVVAARNSQPKLSQLSAAPLADWIILLCIVWLRRIARAVERKRSNLMGAGWSAVVEADSGVSDDRTTVAKDPILTNTLRNASLAAAILITLDDEFGDHDLSPRYHRLKKEETADVVAALWDASMRAENNIDENAEAVGMALASHSVAALALRNRKLLLENAEKALGIRGSAYSAGFTLACAREDRMILSDSSGRGPEWCPYDIVTGRPLPPWVPLRRCVVSGLLAAEMTAPRTDGESMDTPTLVPWVQRWAHESPFGGLWARMPSLDLDRVDLMPAVPYDEQPTQTQRNAIPDQSFSSSTTGVADQNSAAWKKHKAARKKRTDSFQRSGVTAGDFAQSEGQEEYQQSDIKSEANSIDQSGRRRNARKRKTTLSVSGAETSQARSFNDDDSTIMQNRNIMQNRKMMQQIKQEEHSMSMGSHSKGMDPKRNFSQATPYTMMSAQNQQVRGSEVSTMEGLHQNQMPMQQQAPQVQAGHQRMPQPQQFQQQQQFPVQMAQRPGMQAAHMQQTQQPQPPHPQQQTQAQPQLQVQPQGRPQDRRIPGTASQTSNVPMMDPMRPRRVWQGVLSVCSQNVMLSVQCAGEAKVLEKRAELTDTVGWPSVLQCDVNRLHSYDDIKNKIGNPHAQWYVDFRPTSAKEEEQSKFMDLVTQMTTRKLVFEIICDDHPTQRGNLLLFGVQCDNTFLLLGVYLPQPSQPQGDESRAND